MTRHLVDTDVLVDHLRGARPFSLPDGAEGAYSVITRAELYAGRRAEEEPIEELLGALVEVGISTEVATWAGLLRRDHGLGLADAMIAATALDTGRVLVSRNVRQYGPVPELDVVSPP